MAAGIASVGLLAMRGFLTAGGASVGELHAPRFAVRDAFNPRQQTVVPLPLIVNPLREVVRRVLEEDGALAPVIVRRRSP
jgi:hypothetical protein